MATTKGRHPQAGLEPRKCIVCGSSFHPYRDSQVTCHRNCHAKLPHVQQYAREYHAQPENRERKNAARRIGGSRYDVARRNNRANLLKRYGLTPEQYDEMLTRQQGQCIICGNLPDPNGVRASSRLHVDHDHATGANRGLLCTRCNRGIGYFRDDPALLRAAADYIARRHRKG